MASGAGSVGRKCRALAFGFALAALLPACAGSAAWHVPEGREARFREARKVCHQLTDDDGGVLHPERFERCMERRGWRRERFYDRIGIKPF